MNFLDGLAETVNRGFCVVLANTVAAADLLQYVLTPGFGEQYNPFPALYAQNCPLSPPVTPEPSFSGGQCSGAPYQVVTSQSFTYSTPARPPGTQGQSTNVIGKILSVSFDVVVPPDGTRLTIVTENGTVTTPVNTSSGTGGSPGIYTYTNLPTIITRTDGQPDNCGNPPNGGNRPPINYNTYNDSVTYNNTEGDTVNIPVAIVFGYATVNIDGTLNIPVNARFSANPTFNGNFNFNVNTGSLSPDFSNPSSPLPSPCGDPGGYTPDPSIPPPPDSIPDANPLPDPSDLPTEREQPLVACIVTTTFLDGNETTLAQQDNPDIYIPATGYVQFLIRAGNSSAWTTDIPVKSLRAFIPCPWEGGAIDVEGTPRFGNQFTITPVYATRIFHPTYPPDSLNVSLGSNNGVS